MPFPNNKKKGKANNGKWKPKTPKGDIEELGHHVWDYASKGQHSDKFHKTREKLAKWAGIKYNRAMKLLVMGTDSPPKEPKKPTKAPNADGVSPAALEKYGKEVSHWLSQLTIYNEYKAKMFIHALGQCTLPMQNKVEALEKFKEWEENSDVNSLVEAIKDLSHATDDVQYEFMSTATNVRKQTLISQHPNETYPAYYKRFLVSVDILETYWGEDQWFPPKLANGNYTKEEAKGRFQACQFLAGVYPPKAGKVLQDLHNAFIHGRNDYPKTVEAALTLLSNRSDQEKESKKPASPAATLKDDDSADGSTATSFSQKSQRSTSWTGRKTRHPNAKRTCAKCGGQGHSAHQCPNRRAINAFSTDYASDSEYESE